MSEMTFCYAHPQNESIGVCSVCQQKICKVCRRTRDGKEFCGVCSYDRIEVLEDIEAVRTRPGMYIGDTGEQGLHHLVWEVVDNAVDEHMGGFCKQIQIKIHPDGSLSCLDDGRGIPVGIHEKYNKSFLEVALTVLHSGGKFNNETYSFSGGLHGVGVSVVNALSEELEVDVFQKSKQWRQKFAKGIPITTLQEIGETTQRGSLVHFKPDPLIFTTVEFKYPILRKRLRELAFLNAGLTIILEDERSGQKETFFNEGGIQNYLEEFAKGLNSLYPEVILLQGSIQGDTADVKVEIAFKHTDAFGESIHSFANNINTIQGGTHLSGFKTALTRALNNYARKEKKLKDEKNPPVGEDYREGIIAVIKTYVREPQFESQTKVRLLNPNVQTVVESVVTQQLNQFLEEHPKVAELIIGRAEQAKNLREQMKKFSLNARKKAFGGASFPTKLADCNCKDSKGTEVYIVEGDSAGGSAKMGRDTYFQAILPIKGKIINVEKARIDKMLKNSEIEALLQVITPDWRLEENKIVYTKVRYERVIIMTDADVDGSHIRTLLLTFFFRYIPQLIEEGFLYIAQPPLYSVSKGGKNPKYYIYQKDMIQDYAVQGLKDSQLSHRENGVLLKGTELEKILRLSQSLKENGDILNRTAQVNLIELIRSTVSNQWELPLYQVNYFTETTYFHSLEALEKHFLQLQAIHDGLEKIDVEEKHFDPFKHEHFFQITDLSQTRFKDRMLRIFNDLKALEEIGLPLKAFLDGEFVLRSSDFKESIDITSFDSFIGELSKIGQKGLEVKRFKGLGEMDPGELRMTTMDPKNRTLKKVTMLDKESVNMAFIMLMGVEVRERRQFIESRAAKLNWDLLDI